MNRFIPYLLVALLLVPSMASGKRKKKKKKADADVARLLKKIEQLPDLAPGHIRWFESFRDRPRIKINRLDTAESPQLKLLVTALQGDRRVTVRPVDWDTVAKLEVHLSKADDSLEPIAHWPNEEDDGALDLQRADETGIPLDLIVIASGHSGFKDFDQLESAHRSAVSTVLKEVLNANVNVFWVGPALYTFRSFEGITNELSRFDEGLQLCEVERMRALRAKHQDDDTESETPEVPACGLHTGDFAGEHQAKLVGKMRFRGKYSRLFGLNQTGIPQCQSSTPTSTQLELDDLDDDFAQTSDRGAFEEALLQLMQYGTPNSRKAIIILSDGKDGFIEDNELCNENFRTKGPCARLHEEFGRARGGGYRTVAKKIEECVQKRLNRRSTALQERFANRAAPWLALARAANIRVYPVAYAMMRGEQNRVSYAHERERLELLAAKTGGTYREVAYTDWIDAAAASLVSELNEERLITVDANLGSELDYIVQVGLTIQQLIEEEKDGEIEEKVKQYEVRTETIAFKSPRIETGLWHWLKQKNDWLRESVGTILYWVIIVLLAIVALLIVWFVLKLLKAGVMKIVKAVTKKGAKAAKAGAKAAAKSGQKKGK